MKSVALTILFSIFLGSLVANVKGQDNHGHRLHKESEKPNSVMHTPVSIHRQETIGVAYAVEEATSLFTGIGEQYWIPGFKCLPLKGDGFNPKDVFVGMKGDYHATFLVIDYDAAKGHALYGIYNPGVFTGFIEISVTANDDTSLVTVDYKLTSLSQAGADALSLRTEEVFSAEMKEWESSIQNHKHLIDPWLQGRK